MICTICHTEADEDNTLKYLDLYTIGSEGTNVCFTCEMRLVNYIRDMRSLVAKAMIIGVKIGRKDI